MITIVFSARYTDFYSKTDMSILSEMSWSCILLLVLISFFISIQIQKILNYDSK